MELKANDNWTNNGGQKITNNMILKNQNGLHLVSHSETLATLNVLLAIPIAVVNGKKNISTYTILQANMLNFIVMDL